MRLVQMKCSNCNASLNVNLDKLQAFCPYCGQKLLIDMDQMEMILAAKERTKQVQIKEDTKRFREEEKRRRMQLKYDLANDAAERTAERMAKSNRRLFRVLGVLLIVVILLFIVLSLLLKQKAIRETKAGNIRISKNYSDVEVNQDYYEDLEIFFQNAGFTNIECIPVYDVEEGSDLTDRVISVSIGGETKFDYNDWVKPDTKVVIRYHSVNTG